MDDLRINFIAVVADIGLNPLFVMTLFEAAIWGYTERVFLEELLLEYYRVFYVGNDLNTKSLSYKDIIREVDVSDSGELSYLKTIAPTLFGDDPIGNLYRNGNDICKKLG